MKRILLAALALVLAACEAPTPVQPDAAVPPTAFARPDFIAICHYDAFLDQYSSMMIPSNAESPHRNHGDGQVGDPVPGMEGYEFDENCQPVTTGICGATTDFTAGRLPDGWNISVIRGGPGLANDRLQAERIDGGAEIGILLDEPLGVQELTLTYRGNLDPIYHGMWDGIYVATSAGKTWQVNSSTQGYGAGVSPPNRLTASVYDGIGTGWNVWGSGITNGQPLFDDLVIPEQGTYRYTVRLTSENVEWVLHRDSDGSLLLNHSRALPGFDPAQILGIAVFAYTTSDWIHPDTKWIDDLAIACR